MTASSDAVALALLHAAVVGGHRDAVAGELLADSGRSVRVGGKIEYIVTGRNKAVPRELAGDKTDYDVDGYVDNTVRPIYMLLREFGLEYEDLLPGPRQTTLRRYEKYVVCKA